MSAINARVRQKKDTSSNWTSKNPVLLDGELIVVLTDSGETRFKVGDGVKTYTQLPFVDETTKEAIASNASNIGALELVVSPISEDLDSHLANKENPHGVTAEQIGVEPISLEYIDQVCSSVAGDHVSDSAAQELYDKIV